MAGVAKWLRRRFVVPVFGGSIPLACPIFYLKPDSVSDAESGFLFSCPPVSSPEEFVWKGASTVSACSYEGDPIHVVKVIEASIEVTYAA